MTSLGVSLWDAVALPQFDERDTTLWDEKGSRLTSANEWPIFSGTDLTPRLQITLTHDLDNVFRNDAI